jgi:hypothetical protein
MTVYREVVQELQFTQERVDELLSQNQKLVKQNKVLRQEIERVIELSQQLQKIIAASEKPYIPSDPPQKQFVEIKQHLLDSPPLSETDSGMNGWLLAIAISLIILISCGGAFFVVNSLLKK